MAKDFYSQKTRLNTKEDLRMENFMDLEIIMTIPTNTVIKAIGKTARKVDLA
jgi:hypothetical protein